MRQREHNPQKDLRTVESYYKKKMFMSVRPSAFCRNIPRATMEFSGPLSVEPPKTGADRPQPTKKTAKKKMGQPDHNPQRMQKKVTDRPQPTNTRSASLRRVGSRPRRPGVTSPKTKIIQKLLKFRPPNPFLGPARRSPERLVTVQ